MTEHNTKPILFAIEPIRVVAGTSDPLTYLDLDGKPQHHDRADEIVDSGIAARIIYSGAPLDPDDVRAVRSILVAIACERDEARAALARVREAAKSARAHIAWQEGATAPLVQQLDNAIDPRP